MRHDRHRRRAARRTPPRPWVDDTCELCPFEALPGERHCAMCLDRLEREAEHELDERIARREAAEDQWDAAAAEWEADQGWVSP